MSVPVSSPRKDLEVARPSTRTARTGAAKRAYDKRQLRAQIHTRSGGATPSRSGGAIAARIPFVTCIIGLLSIGLALTLLLTTRSTEDSYQLTAQRQQNQSLTEQAAALERDVETANSAPELAKRAKALGMIPTKDVPRLVVAPDGSVQVIGKPAAATGPPAPDFDAAAPTGPVAGSPNSTASPTTQGREALTPLGTGAQPTTPAPTPTPTAVRAPTAVQAPAPVTAAPVPAAPAAGEQQVPA